MERIRGLEWIKEISQIGVETFSESDERSFPNLSKDMTHIRMGKASLESFESDRQRDIKLMVGGLCFRVKEVGFVVKG